MLIKVILVSFLLFSISRVLLQLRNRNLGSRSSFFWITIWIAALVGIISPELTSRVARVFGIGRGADVVIYISIALLFYLIFRLSIFIENLRHDIGKLSREIALMGTKRKRVRS